MSENMTIWEAVRQVPGEAKKKIMAGRLKGMTDIKPQWRLKIMTEQFGPIGIGWYYKPVKSWKEEANGEISVHVEVELYIKDGENWSMPISGVGGSMLMSKETIKDWEKEQLKDEGLLEKYGDKYFKLYHSDEAFKMATTDALSVAMKQLGVAADVYMGLSDSKYDKHTESHPVGQYKANKADSDQRKTMEAYLKQFTKAGDVKAIDYISEALANPELTEQEASTIIKHAKAKVG